MHLSRSHLVLALVAATALTGCSSGGGGGGGGTTGGITPPTTFDVTRSLGGIAKDTQTPVYSIRANENPNSTRYTIEFTSAGTIELRGTGGSTNTTLDQSDVVTSFGAPSTAFSMYTTRLQAPNRIVDIYVPQQVNGADYAIVRNVNTASGPTVDYLLVGQGTSNVLTGSATYNGGYIAFGGNHGSAGSQDNAIGALTMTANFAGNANAINFNLANNANAFGTGVTSIDFSADFNPTGNLIDGMAKTVTSNGAPGKFDQANIHGFFANGGNSAVGLIRLDDTTNAVPDLVGGFHATK